MSADTEAAEQVAQGADSDKAKTQSTPDAAQSGPTAGAKPGASPDVGAAAVRETALPESALPESGSTESGSTETASTETGATESGSTESGSTETVAPEAGSKDGAPINCESIDTAAATGAAEKAEGNQRPSGRIQVGSQRERDSSAAAKPVSTQPAPAAEAAPAKSNYPPPNVRDQLPAELEQELEAALGGQSLDEIIDQVADGSPAATGAELDPETKITGTVLKVHREDVFLDLGGRDQGLLPLKQFEKTEPPEVGAQLEVIVARFNTDQGLYEVSLPTAAVSVGNWNEVEVGQLVEVTITGANKGGLECQLAGIRGFIPMGQISIYRVENPEEYVGQRLACVITEANRDRKNLVLSHRAMMERERKEKREQLLAELAPGQIREGVVRSLRDFGAFVDLGGIDGMVHVSQLSWERIKHPRDVLQEGQSIKVRVEKVDQETGKIALAYRDLADNPWKNAAGKYAAGSTIGGKVTKLMPFGAFVKLEPGVEGLIHISEMGHGRVKQAGDVVSEGQDVEVKVISVDADAQRISLSLKALMPVPEKAAPREPDPAEVAAAQAIKNQRDEQAKHLKGGISAPSGGEKFGLNW